MDKEAYGVFDVKVLAKLNEFLQKWRIAPAAPGHSVDAEQFYFPRVLEGDDYEDREFEQYEWLSDDSPIISEWEKIEHSTLFTGQFYQLANDQNFCF